MGIIGYSGKDIFKKNITVLRCVHYYKNFSKYHINSLYDFNFYGINIKKIYKNV